ncbi:hypothetical protein [Legionella erythra]|uniref:Uncharacterized protein n=1 Tax=Legionella erythra TaxID=448 RepID=A0A0W0TS60_LEGER|nr:hypothetical protein [Legionella erythra]KTC98439.1 hypothetical protein Lery_0907 [Legionella erythra]
MKYLVTYCAFDTETSNPLWHSAFILSQWDESEGNHAPIEVVATYGFYGVPTTTRNTWAAKIKLLIGFDVDMNGNHGMLRPEETRFMDFGSGMHGVSFELTMDQFHTLHTKCKKMMQDQEDTIRETAQFFKLKPADKKRIYPYEQWSALIYETEKIRASNEGREPRLKPFEINPSLTWSGPSLSQSHTCKSQVIRLLEGILSPKQIARLTENGKHPTVPRYSGPMEPLALYSEGPLKTHVKSDGTAVHFRDGANPQVTLRWTLPPQEIEAISEDTLQRVKLPEEHLPRIRTLCKRLQRLEWLFINAQLPATYEPYRKALIELIRTSYQVFSKTEPKDVLTELPGWKGTMRYLFSIPRNEYEKTLLSQIQQGENLLNSLYMAMVDNWKIEEGCPLESRDPSPAESSRDVNDAYENPAEAIAAYLTEIDKERACKIIGRNYVSPDDEDEIQDDAPFLATPALQ